MRDEIIRDALKLVGDRCEAENVDVFEVGFFLCISIVKIMALAGYDIDQMIKGFEKAAYREIEGTEH